MKKSVYLELLILELSKMNEFWYEFYVWVLVQLCKYRYRYR